MSNGEEMLCSDGESNYMAAVAIIQFYLKKLKMFLSFP